MHESKPRSSIKFTNCNLTASVRSRTRLESARSVRSLRELEGGGPLTDSCSRKCSRMGLSGSTELRGFGPCAAHSPCTFGISSAQYAAATCVLGEFRRLTAKVACCERIGQKKNKEKKKVFVSVFFRFFFCFLFVFFSSSRDSSSRSLLSLPDDGITQGHN